MFLLNYRIRGRKLKEWIVKKIISIITVFHYYSFFGKPSVKTTIGLSFFIVLNTSLFAQKPVTEVSHVYKRIDTTALSLIFFYPEFIEAEGNPAVIFFFGGGWKKGDITQFKPHAQYFAKQGVIAVLAEYRIENKHGTSPFESLKDAKSAIRYLRKNASSLQINKNRIIAAGGSAGGQLAAACALTDGFEQDGEDLSISSTPNALVLFNPVIDNGPGGYGFQRIGERYHHFSPLHNLSKGAPPTIIFLGTDDKFVPVETVEYYKTIMERVGSRCDLHLYKGEKHGFFNHTNKKYYEETLYESHKFLFSLGYIRNDPSIVPKD